MPKRPSPPLQLRLLPLCAALASFALPAPLFAARTAYYQFESETEPGLDSAGGDDGAVRDGGTWSQTGAVAGTGAYLLDGKTPGFTIPAGQNLEDADFSATENFTVSAWFRVTAATGRQRIFSTAPGWGLGVDFTQAGMPRILMTAYALEDKFFEAPDIITGKWYQVTVVVTPTDENGTVYTRVFLNGQQIGSDDDGNYNSPVNSLLIGSAGNGFEGFNGALDELSYYDTALSDSEVTALYQAVAVDTDGDGMLDSWETAYGLKPNLADGTGDLDADGLSNRQEYDLGLLPNAADTDGDGFADGVEDSSGEYTDAGHTGTDPKNPDSDGDTLLDGAEIAVTATDPHSTNPTKRDTDDDGLPDNYEILIAKSDPTNPASPALVPNLIAEYRFELPEFPGLDSAGGDDSATVTGGSWVSTGALSGRGAYSFPGNSPGLTIGTGSPEPDPDFSTPENFSISTWFNVASAAGRQRILCCSSWGLGLDFNNPTPRVLMTTFGVEDKFFDAPMIVPGRWFHLAAIVMPPDGEGVVYTRIYVDGVFIGQDDGPYTGATSLAIGSGGPGGANEAFNGLLDELRFYDKALSDAEIGALYAVGSSDEDNDGMPANWELTYGLNPISAADAAGDLDGDGVTNLDEYKRGLLPNNKDTDGDGLEDGVEDGGKVYLSATQTGTDPRKVDSDGDGLSDRVENNSGIFVDAASTGSNPNLIDTDGDGIPDGYEVATLFTNPVDPSDPNRPPGLVAHYTFDDESNLGIDSAGEDDNATPTSGVFQITGDDAKVGAGAVYLSGNDFLRIGSGSFAADAAFTAVSGFSTAVWFNLADTVGRQRILSAWPGWGLGANFSEGPAGLLFTAYGVVDAYFPATLTAGEWHHLACTVGPADPGAQPLVTMYLDGLEVGQQSFLINPPGANFAIGSFNSDGVFESFTGGLDDLRYYNEAITAAEVAALAGVAVGGDAAFQISSVTLSGGRVTLTFPSENGAGYTVQRSATMTGAWETAGTLNGTGGAATWTEPSAPPAGSGRWFYRVLKNE